MSEFGGNNRQIVSTGRGDTWGRRGVLLTKCQNSFERGGCYGEKFIKNYLELSNYYFTFAFVIE